MESTPEQRRRLLNKVLIVCGLSAALLFFGYVIYLKRSPRHYFIPQGYTGWVTIRYEKPGAPPLPEKDGALQLYIPANGILETSSPLEQGWARDEHYWWDGSTATLIPKHLTENNEDKRWIHSQQESSMDYGSIYAYVRDGEDTTLWDGATISRKDTFYNVDPGRKLIEHFYVSGQPEPFFYVHDTLPPGSNRWQ